MIYDFSELDITTFALIFLRMTGMVMTNPIIGRRSSPRLFRGGMIFLLSLVVFLYGGVEHVQVGSFVVYVYLLLKEFVVGYVLGLIANLFMYVVSFASAQIDMQMGTSMSQVYDPGSNVSMSVTGNFYNTMFIFIFFTTNAHLTLIRLFMDSSQILPYGSMTVIIDSRTSEVVLDLFCQCTTLGLKMAIPIIFMELLIEFAIGALMKAVPQINVFILNIQIKLIMGMVYILILMSPMTDFFEDIIQEMFNGMYRAINVMAG